MHDYLLSTEVVRFAFVFGVAVSMLLYERRHVTTGSIVVPGYIATFIVYPLVIVATFVNALVSYLIVNRILRRWFLLYGRTKFTVLALVSILIQTAMLKLSPSGPWLWESDFKLFVGVGYVVPALIAHDMGRQGVARTARSVMLAATIVATPIALALALDLPGINDLAPLQGRGESAIEPAWIPVAVLLSAAAAWGVAHNYSLRSGGFVGAAFVGVLIADPWQVIIAVAIASVTYLVVTRFLMNTMILFGRRKFSAMLLVSSSLSWALLWLGAEVFGAGMQEHLDLGSLALTPLFIPGLLANDAQRTSPMRVLVGTSVATTFVLTTTWWIESLFEGLHLAFGWKLVSVAAFTAIFWRQFVPAQVGERRTSDARDVRPVPAPTITMVRPTFGKENFERWAAIHREAADAAERWLDGLLVGTSPPPLAARAPAGPPVAGDHILGRERAAERLRRAAIRSLTAPASKPAPALPRRRPRADPGHTTSQRSVGPSPTTARHPVPASSLPTAPRSSAQLAALILPDGGWRRPEASEPPDATPHRAHLVASGARFGGSNTTEREHDTSSPPTAFPG